MFTGMGLSLFAALMLFTATGVARAGPVRSALDASEEGNPDSVNYANRMFGSHPPSNDEINAAEAGSPDSLEYKDQRGSSSGDWRAAWQALESNHPDFR